VLGHLPRDQNQKFSSKAQFDLGQFFSKWGVKIHPSTPLATPLIGYNLDYIPCNLPEVTQFLATKRVEDRRQGTSTSI